MQKSNNDITIDESTDSMIITIQFKKSVYASTIWMYIVVLLILCTVGLTTFISSIINQSFDDSFFIFMWLFIAFFITYQATGEILWHLKGKEVITLKHNQIILQKFYPSFKFDGSTQEKTVIISMNDLKRVYYSRYTPWRNSLPGKSKGNLHFQDQHQKYSFAINLNQQECTPIIRLIKEKVPNIETNV